MSNWHTDCRFYINMNFREQTELLEIIGLRTRNLQLTEFEKKLRILQLESTKSDYNQDFWFTSCCFIFFLMCVVLQLINGITNDLSTTLPVLLSITAVVLRLSRAKKSTDLQIEKLSKEIHHLDTQIELSQERLNTLETHMLRLERQEIFDTLLTFSSREQSGKIQDQLRRRTAAPAA